MAHYRPMRISIVAETDDQHGGLLTTRSRLFKEKFYARKGSI
jgi:hypothetical protein